MSVGGHSFGPIPNPGGTISTPSKPSPSPSLNRSRCFSGRETGFPEDSISLSVSGVDDEFLIGILRVKRRTKENMVWESGEPIRGLDQDQVVDRLDLLLYEGIMGSREPK